MTHAADRLFMYIACTSIFFVGCGAKMAPASPAGEAAATAQASSSTICLAPAAETASAPVCASADRPCISAHVSGGKAPSSCTTSQPTPASSPSSATGGSFARAPAGDDAMSLDFNDAEALVAASLGDCTAACRALTSLESAVTHICRIEPGAAECSQVRARANAARARVELACGRCPTR